MKLAAAAISAVIAAVTFDVAAAPFPKETALRRLMSSGGTVYSAVVDHFRPDATCSRYRIVPASKERGAYVVTAETAKDISGYDLALTVHSKEATPPGHCTIELAFLGPWRAAKSGGYSSGIGDMTLHCVESATAAYIGLSGERWFFRRGACEEYIRAKRAK